MKAKYVFEQEEITTCNGCPFCHYVYDEGMDDHEYCHFTKNDVTDHCFDNTKPDTCPLITVD